jgi:hypothetical protein
MARPARKGQVSSQGGAIRGFTFVGGNHRPRPQRSAGSWTFV